MIDIKDKSQCCGCNACEQSCPKQCIRKIEDSEGFFYPQVDINVCIDCSLCEKVCPVLNLGITATPLSTEAIIFNEEKKRLASSSGGVFTGIAEEVISRGGVVFGAKWTEDWHVVHDYTETIEGLAAFRGSKYVQCDTSDSYTKVRDFLKSDRWVLYTGTPCQIRGLKLFLRKEYEKLITIDFICHGVPSPKVFHAYLKEELSNIKTSNVHSEVKLSNIEFRNKDRGWHHYQLALECIAEGEVVKHLIPSSIFMKGFGLNLYQRPSCHNCKARNFSSGSDFTLADYWGVENQHPDMDDDKGTSLVAINSEKANELINSITNLKRKIVNMQKAYRSQVSLYRSLPIPSSRQYFWQSDWENHFSETVIKLIPKISVKQKTNLAIRAILRTLGVKKLYNIIRR